jgi:hypothetical protein
LIRFCNHTKKYDRYYIKKFGVCGSGFPAAISTTGVKTIRSWKAAPTIKWENPIFYESINILYQIFTTIETLLQR